MSTRILLPALLATLLSASEMHATHTLQYYVYYETVYYQGPWTGAGSLDRLEPRYLSPVLYSDNFGTMRTEFVMKVLDRLRTEKPEVYQWRPDIDINGDTVILTSVGPVDVTETMLNELSASFTSSGFDVVSLRHAGGARTWTADSIRLPMLAVMLPEAAAAAVEPVAENRRTGGRRILLLLSLGLNVLLLLGILFVAKKRN